MVKRRNPYVRLLDLEITALGQTIAAVIAILGIGMFALPAGRLGAGFVDALAAHRSEDSERRCPHCGELLEE